MIAVMDKTLVYIKLVPKWIYFGIFCVSLSVQSENIQDVYDKRQKLLEEELNLMLGSDIVLTNNEILVNNLILDLKNKELDEGFNNPQFFNMSKHFFDYKDDVKKTELFKLIQEMPKGAVLHTHDAGILSPDYLVNITYTNNLYVCFEEDDASFLFSKDLPTSACCTQWQLIKDARYFSGNVVKFDKELRKLFTLVVDNPNEVYSDINTVWKKFEDYFIRTNPLITFKPVKEQYFYDALNFFREDNVMYVEYRGGLSPLYDLEGNTFNSVAHAEIYKKVLDKFVEDYPDFFGAKLIYAPYRLAERATMKEFLKTTKEIKKRLPDFLAGFDLVGQEDRGLPTNFFLSELVVASEEIDYFFHVGETNWYGSTSDENLIDAIVLNSKRIGHAFALIKHPLLLEQVKNRGIAIEVNIISNTVLGLVKDVRNHPLASYMAQNLPVVVSCDDPGLWEADPLSHDFYVAFVGIASRYADLRVLKKLALNSLYYSTYPNKDKLVYEFEFRWTKFIDAVIKRKLNVT